jgi:hypothetical protein
MDSSSDIKKQVWQVPSEDFCVTCLVHSERPDLHHRYTYLQTLRLFYQNQSVCSSASGTTSYFHN